MPHWFVSIDEIIKFENIDKKTNRRVAPVSNTLIYFFNFIFTKLNKKCVAKNGTRIIPINPKWPKK